VSNRKDGKPFNTAQSQWNEVKRQLAKGENPYVVEEALELPHGTVRRLLNNPRFTRELDELQAKRNANAKTSISPALALLKAKSLQAANLLVFNMEYNGDMRAAESILNRTGVSERQQVDVTHTTELTLPTNPEAAKRMLETIQQLSGGIPDDGK
jgi:hypothetical protein